MVESTGRYWVRLHRDVVKVSGPEAETFLQGQLSQDLSLLDRSGSVWSWLLAPTGKVDALLRVSRTGDGSLVIDTDAGWGEAVLARLVRFKLRTRADLELVAASVVGLRGQGSDPDGQGWEREALGAGAAVVATPPWPGLAGADLIYLEGSEEPFRAPDGVAEMDAADYEAVRIASGQPRMGAELTERTIPGETGLVPFTVSFTKGCYTGQELVARIDSRGGNVARHLRRLFLSAPAEPGSELYDGDRPAGTVTSVAPAGVSRWIALGYVRRGIEPPCRLAAGVGGPSVEVEAISW